MEEYFIKNQAIFSKEDQELLKNKKVLVAGCGGLGGSVIELIVRSGIGHMVLADGDSFEPSNMNRQLLCTVDTLGCSKAQAAKERVLSVNPDAEVEVVKELLTADNVAEYIEGCDIAIDALDSVSGRLMLEDACEKAGIYLIHGAVKGWSLQMGVCPPGSRMLHKLYSGKGLDKGMGGIAMTVFACASFEVSEAIKILLSRNDSLSGNLLFFDLLDKESQILPFI